MSAEDFMDDGTPICLTITIDRRDGSALFDFTGQSSSFSPSLERPQSSTQLSK